MFGHITTPVKVIEVSRIGRFCVMRHETFSDTTQAKWRAAGIDPDSLHTVAFSYDDEASAKARLMIEQIRNTNPFLKYVYHDMGFNDVVETVVGVMV